MLDLFALIAIAVLAIVYWPLTLILVLGLIVYRPLDLLLGTVASLIGAFVVCIDETIRTAVKAVANLAHRSRNRFRRYDYLTDLDLRGMTSVEKWACAAAAGTGVVSTGLSVWFAHGLIVGPANVPSFVLLFAVTLVTWFAIGFLAHDPALWERGEHERAWMMHYSRIAGDDAEVLIRLCDSYRRARRVSEFVAALQVADAISRPVRL